MTKRELLEACARVTGREPYRSISSDNHVPWNPVDDDGDCARMEEQMRISVDWCNDAVIAQPLTNVPGVLESFEDHPTPQAARRWASCRAVAAMKEKDMTPTPEQVQAWAREAGVPVSSYAELNPIGMQSFATLAYAAGAERDTDKIMALIANDAYACTFQTVGQYRTALLAALEKPL